MQEMRERGAESVRKSSRGIRGGIEAGKQQKRSKWGERKLHFLPIMFRFLIIQQHKYTHVG